ncbi:MAG: pyruvate ferredoxin oxidoreductase [candidate division KSB1 bacterium]|nr:pyruvate ferredoxin oxidoreductase [candidate division KSB1 bacterium]MDZ7303524.1 pyruvate ferredoxin oxidoreductase [candidate division KSB1 bacterium]MDZ7312674.1 pyruvate ferredoxin oxidoreductase [candidate division KSB1 bacterium]
MKQVLMGNHAVSYGARLARVEVISAYPITPQTQIVEELSELCARGELRARFVNVESEHSAMASCIGASAGGARAFTATSSQGLALMHELLHWASGARLPIVMANVNRAMAPGWSIWTEQTDSLAQRDTGWLQFYCESNQEVLDTTIQAFKISEQLLLPSMIVLDAFFLSHTYEPVDVPEPNEVDAFLPPYRPKIKMEVNDPHAFGALVAPENYYEFRYNIQKDFERAPEVIERVGREFGEQFGRYYGLVEAYQIEDADLVLVTSSTITSTARAVIKERRARGEKVGLLKIRVFRPFPFAALRQALLGVPKVAVIDRNISFGHHGIFYSELKSALYGQDGAPLVFGFVAGLGGRDVTPQTINEILDFTKAHDFPEKEIYWIGLKSQESEDEKREYSEVSASAAK